MKYLPLLFALCSTFLSKTAFACVCSPMSDLDSVVQLNSYAFIAHVFVRDAGDRNIEGRYQENEAIRFRIITQFKGVAIDSILESSKYSSCDIGISDGEEWILFGIVRNGRLFVSPCDRNIRLKNRQGEREWRFQEATTLLKKLATFYRHPQRQYPDGRFTTYYTNGCMELEEHYLAGQLHGQRKVWYANGQLYGSENYLNGELEGKATWFYPGGQLSDEMYYRSGKRYNVSRFYYDTALTPIMRKVLIELAYKTEDSLNRAFSRVQVQYESVFDYDGTRLAGREYDRMGNILHETLHEKKNDTAVRVQYFPNGLIHSISRWVGSRPVGDYHEFNRDGTLRRRGRYDENGNLRWENR